MIKCQSCQEEISPKFAHAIATNSCPFCGQEIMTQQLREILTNLKGIFDDGKEHLDEISDWLSTNYGFKRISENEAIIEKVELEHLKEFAASNRAGAGSKLPTPVRRHNINEEEDDDESVEMGSVGQMPKPVARSGAGKAPPVVVQSEFAKRAGVKPEMLQNTVDFIMNKAKNGGAPLDFNMPVSDPQAAYDEEQSIHYEGKDFPINESLEGSSPLEGLFESSEYNGVSPALEMEQIKRLQRQSSSTKQKAVTRRD